MWSGKLRVLDIRAKNKILVNTTFFVCMYDYLLTKFAKFEASNQKNKHTQRLAKQIRAKWVEFEQ